ncbi:MAG: hypothetical protein LC720_05760, partial [Actinobacteria bacterium]|nr:hypothetical protein [Actinomycetota bacterium]
MRRHRHEAGTAGRARTRGLSLLTGLVAACAVLFGAVSPASAGVGFLVVPNVPSPLTVGETGVPASLTLTNGSNGMEAGLSVLVTQITLVPSCGTKMISGADCPAGAEDPGVLRVSPTGVGE